MTKEQYIEDHYTAELHYWTRIGLGAGILIVLLFLLLDYVAVRYCQQRNQEPFAESVRRQLNFSKIGQGARIPRLRSSRARPFGK